MAISPMKKLSLVALREDVDRLMREMLFLSCVEIRRYKPEEYGLGADKLPLASVDCAAERARCEEQLRLASGALELTMKFRTDAKGLRKPPRRVLTRGDFEEDSALYQRGLQAAQTIMALDAEAATIRSERNRKTALLHTMQPWRALPCAFEEVATRRTETLFGTVPTRYTMADAQAALAAADDTAAFFEEISSDTNNHYVTLTAHRDTQALAVTAAEAVGFSRLNLAGGGRKPAEIAEEAERELAEMECREKEIAATIREMGSAVPDLEILTDLLRSRLCELDGKARLCRTDSAVVLTAWVPAKAEGKVSAVLDTFRTAYQFEDPTPEENDDVPILLQNKKLFRPFESVVSMYALPEYGKFDPTTIMSFFYFIAFGLILADVGYGLMLIIGGFLLIKLMRIQGGAKKLLHLLIICGFACTAAGVVFGSYFGDLPKQVAENVFGIQNFGNIALWFDPVSDPVKYLILSLGFGVIHITAGLIIKMVNLFHRGDWFAAVFDVGSWLLLFVGIGLYFLSATPGLILIITAVLMLVCTQGRKSKNIIGKLLNGILSLYDMVGYISDVLSYSRILALGLATSVIAQVINVFAVMPGRPHDVLSWIVSVVALVVAVVLGHTLNLVLNALGAYVHAGRLQYIEFFGKFYEDGGRLFEPVAPAITYADINILEPNKMKRIEGETT